MPLPSLLAATRSLIDQTANHTGEEYYRTLARGLSENLGFRFGMVGHQLPGSPRRMRLRAVFGHGQFLDPFDYALDGTPCDEVLQQGFCHFQDGVAQRFPQVELFLKMGIQSYAGSRIASGPDRPGGLVIVLHDAPTHHSREELATALDFLSLRTAAEFEHERVEAALKASEARYRGLIESCAEGVWLIDAEGRTSFVNEQMARMLGHAPNEMLGRPMFDFMDSAAQRQATGNLQRRREGIREQHEFRLKRKDGSDLWTIMATAPILDEQGAFQGAQALVTDLTARRHLEAGVLEAQKLESLGVLAGGIAHDFNNLLVGVLGNARLALMHLPHESSERGTLEDIETAALRMADLTRQMLAYSGKGQFVIQRLSLNKLIEEIGQLLASVVSKRAQLRYSLSPLPMEVEGDLPQLRQLVMNLVSNASDALGDQDGVITVTTSLVRADREYLQAKFPESRLSEGEYVHLEVSDTGMGMDDGTRTKIFDPFFTTKFTGRGLGLPAVLGILRGHRGAVRVHSELGKGSRFELILPRASPQPQAVTLPRPPVSSLRGTGLVLVADDERGVRRVAARILREAGFEVLEACDGLEAVQIIDREKHRLCATLLDLTMPGLSGEEVLAHMRQVAPGIRVVLTSGYSEKEGSGHFASLGVSGFLPKPWTPEDLEDAFRVALGS